MSGDRAPCRRRLRGAPRLLEPRRAGGLQGHQGRPGLRFSLFQVDIFGELFDGGPREESREGEAHGKNLPDGRHEAHGQQRVASQVEEAGLDAHGVLHIQYLPPDRLEAGLGGGLRRHVSLFLMDPHRQREGPAVELAARRPGQRIHESDERGDHVLG